MKSLNAVALILVIVGAINWGLVGLFQFDLVAAIFGGSGALLARLVYILVALSGVLLIPMLKEMFAPAARAPGAPRPTA